VPGNRNAAYAEAAVTGQINFPAYVSV